MVVRYYNLKDIKTYEMTTGNSILSMLRDVSVVNLVELIRLGNYNMTEEDAYIVLQDALDSGLGIIDIHDEIKECIFGRGMDDDEKGLDIEEYTNLTDIYLDLGMKLTSMGITFTELWSMTTYDMHKMFISLESKEKRDTNRELSMAHALSAMIGQAVWGKLGDVPTVGFSEDEEANGLDRDTQNSMLALTKLSAMTNSKYRKEV